MARDASGPPLTADDGSISDAERLLHHFLTHDSLHVWRQEHLDIVQRILPAIVALAAAQSRASEAERERDELREAIPSLSAMNTYAKGLRRQALEEAAMIADEMFDQGFSAYAVAGRLRSLASLSPESVNG